MRKIFLPVVAFIFFGFILAQSSFAAIKRYATCDACGLCPIIDVESGTCTVTKPDPADATKTINLWPGDWGSCVKCLYPSLYPSGNPVPNNNCKTLLVDGTTNLPQNPVKTGRQFTMLGCITSGTSVGFNNTEGDQGGARSFVQKLLDVIFSLAGGLAFLYLMYGAFIILTSQADPERLNYGRRLIYGAIAGLIITVASVFIVNLIGSGILHIPGFTGATTPTP